MEEGREGGRKMRDEHQRRSKKVRREGYGTVGKMGVKGRESEVMRSSVRWFLSVTGALT